MELQDLKRWHWIVIGLLAGLALGGMRIFWGPAYQHSTARTLSQELFERGLAGDYDSAPRLSSLVLHPPLDNGSCWITGTFTEEVSASTNSDDPLSPRVRKRITGPFKYRASMPYRPRIRLVGMPAGDTTVRAYMDAVATRLPAGQVQYHCAWYEQKTAALALWAGGTTLAIGGFWPILLKLLAGAGLGPAPKPAEAEYELNRFGSPPVPGQPPASGAVAPTQEQTAALAAKMADRLEDATLLPTEPPTAPPTATAIPRLSVMPLEVAAAIAEENSKDYAGEFYPTAAHAAEKGKAAP